MSIGMELGSWLGMAQLLVDCIAHSNKVLVVMLSGSCMQDYLAFKQSKSVMCACHLVDSYRQFTVVSKMHVCLQRWLKGVIGCCLRTRSWKHNPLHSNKAREGYLDICCKMVGSSMS